MATGFGARLVGRLGGGEPRIREYYVPSTDTTALLVGDFVTEDGVGALDPNSEVPVITRAATTDPLVGVIIGFKPDASLPYTGQYRAGSTNRYVLVCDDQDAVYEMQEDAVGGTIAKVDIGYEKNVAIVVASGSTVTGLSGSMIDSSTITTSASDLKIVGVRRDPSNPALVGVSSGAGAILLVKINTTALNTNDNT